MTPAASSAHLPNHGLGLRFADIPADVVFQIRLVGRFEAQTAQDMLSAKLAGQAPEGFFKKRCGVPDHSVKVDQQDLIVGMCFLEPRNQQLFTKLLGRVWSFLSESRVGDARELVSDAKYY